jgi:hypothetical protein
LKPQSQGFLLILVYFCCKVSFNDFYSFGPFLLISPGRLFKEIQRGQT